MYRVEKKKGFRGRGGGGSCEVRRTCIKATELVATGPRTRAYRLKAARAKLLHHMSRLGPQFFELGSDDNRAKGTKYQPVQLKTMKTLLTEDETGVVLPTAWKTKRQSYHVQAPSV